MNQEDLLVKLRKQYPQYSDLSDGELLNRYLAKNPHALHTPKPYSPPVDSTSSQGLQGQKTQDEPGIFASLFGDESADIKKKAAEARVAVANASRDVELAVGEIRKAETKNARAAEIANMELTVQQAELKNQFTIAEEATIQKIPVADYSVLKLEQIRLEAAHNARKLEMELELEKEKLSTRHAIELQLIKQDLRFQHQTKLLDRIAALHLEIVNLGRSDLEPLVRDKQVELKSKEMKQLEAQYNERVEQSSMEDAEE